MGRSSLARKARIGYDYVHSAIDDHSRLAYSEILSDEKGATCAAFLTRAANYFCSCGITTIERVITDNHFSYRRSNDVVVVIADLGAKHVFIKPHCPWQNGKVERYNRILQTQWAYRQVFITNDARCAALAPWLQHCRILAATGPRAVAREAAHHVRANELGRHFGIVHVPERGRRDEEREENARKPFRGRLDV
jgi:Integrase core domain